MISWTKKLSKTLKFQFFLVAFSDLCELNYFCDEKASIKIIEKNYEKHSETVIKLFSFY